MALQEKACVFHIKTIDLGSVVFAAADILIRYADVPLLQLMILVGESSAIASWAPPTLNIYQRFRKSCALHTQIQAGVAI